MIWESCYWKEPLLKAAKWLRSIRLGENTQERTYVRIEKEIFWGFYSIRKLLDARTKLSDHTYELRFSLKTFKNVKKVDELNWHKLDELYDLEDSNIEQRDIRYLCNQFIHSFVFIPSGETRLEGIYIASDRIRNQKLYFVSLDQILRAFRAVGRDYPSAHFYERDLETGSFKINSW